MAETNIALCNNALSYIGFGKQISSLEEESQQAATCKLHYDPARREVLKVRNWPFARKYVLMGLVEENPTLEWGYAYRYPSDCLKVRRILTTVRNDPNPPPYMIGRDTQGKLLYCDIADVEIEYTVDEETTTRFDALFDDALAWKLGKKLAPSLARLKGAIELCEKGYLDALALAGDEAANEEQDSPPPDAESIRVRA